MIMPVTLNMGRSKNPKKAEDRSTNNDAMSARIKIPIIQNLKIFCI